MQSSNLDDIKSALDNIYLPDGQSNSDGSLSSESDFDGFNFDEDAELSSVNGYDSAILASAEVNNVQETEKVIKENAHITPDVAMVHKLLSSNHGLSINCRQMELQLQEVQLNLKAVSMSELHLKEECNSLRYDLAVADEDNLLLQEKIKKITLFTNQRDKRVASSDEADTISGMDEIRGSLLSAAHQRIIEQENELLANERVIADLTQTIKSNSLSKSTAMQALEEQLSQMQGDIATRTILYAAQERRWRDECRYSESSTSELKLAAHTSQARLEEIEKRFEKADRQRLDSMMTCRQLEEKCSRLENADAEQQENIITLNNELNEAVEVNNGLQQIVDQLRRSGGDTIEENIMQQADSQRISFQQKERLLLSQAQEAKDLLKRETEAAHEVSLENARLTDLLDEKESLLQSYYQQSTMPSFSEENNSFIAGTEVEETKNNRHLDVLNSSNSHHDNDNANSQTMEHHPLPQSFNDGDEDTYSKHSGYSSNNPDDSVAGVDEALLSGILFGLDSESLEGEEVRTNDAAMQPIPIIANSTADVRPSASPSNRSDKPVTGKLSLIDLHKKYTPRELALVGALKKLAKRINSVLLPSIDELQHEVSSLEEIAGGLKKSCSEEKEKNLKIAKVASSLHQQIEHNTESHKQIQLSLQQEVEGLKIMKTPTSTVNAASRSSVSTLEAQVLQLKGENEKWERSEKVLQDQVKGYQEELRNLELEWKTQAYATKQSMAMEHETAIRAMEQSIASLTAQLAASTAINENVVHNAQVEWEEKQKLTLESVHRQHKADTQVLQDQIEHQQTHYEKEFLRLTVLLNQYEENLSSQQKKHEVELSANNGLKHENALLRNRSQDLVSFGVNTDDSQSVHEEQQERYVLLERRMEVEYQDSLKLALEQQSNELKRLHMAECQEERAVNEEKWHRSLVEVKAKMRSKYDARLQKLQLRFAAEQERVLEMVRVECTAIIQEAASLIESQRQKEKSEKSRPNIPMSKDTASKTPSPYTRPPVKSNKDKSDTISPAAVLATPSTSAVKKVKKSLTKSRSITPASGKMVSPAIEKVTATLEAAPVSVSGKKNKNRDTEHPPISVGVSIGTKGLVQKAALSNGAAGMNVEGISTHTIAPTASPSVYSSEPLPYSDVPRVGWDVRGNAVGSPFTDVVSVPEEPGTREPGTQDALVNHNKEGIRVAVTDHPYMEESSNVATAEAEAMELDIQLSSSISTPYVPYTPRRRNRYSPTASASHTTPAPAYAQPPIQSSEIESVERVASFSVAHPPVAALHADVRSVVAGEASTFDNAASFSTHLVPAVRTSRSSGVPQTPSIMAYSDLNRTKKGWTQLGVERTSLDISQGVKSKKQSSTQSSIQNERLSNSNSSSISSVPEGVTHGGSWDDKVVHDLGAGSTVSAPTADATPQYAVHSRRRIVTPSPSSSLSSLPQLGRPFHSNFS